MFGNIVPARQELKVKDYATYRAYYCGVCRSMGRLYSGLCGLGLSYESTFIAILLSALSPNKVKLEHHACLANPIRKKAMVVDNEQVDLAATINVLLMYRKLKDNVQDEGDFKSRCGMLLFKHSYRKAAETLEKIQDVIDDRLEEQRELELEGCASIDRAAEPFSEMMGEIEAQFAEKDAPREVMYWFGLFLGKWLFVLDAFEDIEKDQKNKVYNPFLAANPQSTVQEIVDKSKGDADYILSGAMAELARLFDKMQIHRNKEIIENILFVGMPAVTEDVLSGRRKNSAKGKDKMLSEMID